MSKSKLVIIILFFCMLMPIAMLFAFATIQSELGSDKLDFEEVTTSMARQLFDNPVEKPSFVRSMYPDAGEIVNLSDADEVCIRLIGEGFNETFDPEDLAFHLSTQTLFAVDGQSITMGPAYIDTVMYADLTTNFSICGSIKPLERGIHVVQMKIPMTRDSIYNHSWAFRVE